MKKTSLAYKINKRIILYVAGLMLLGGVFSLMQLQNAQNSSYEEISNTLKMQIQSKEISKGEIGMVASITLAQNPKIIKSLIKNNRNLAIKELNNLSSAYKNGTPFKNVKVHLHTSDLHSFVRDWKTEKFGDDLSKFRDTIVNIKNTKKPFFAIEVGRAGLVMRGLSPIFDNKNYVGSIEFIQGLNSVVKALKIEKTDLLVLMDKKYKRGNALTSQNKIGNYYISQKIIDKSFKNDAKNINLATLVNKNFLIHNDRFYVTTPIKDFKGNIIGMYLISKYLIDINESIKHTENLVYFMSGVNFLIVILILVLLSIMLSSILNKELEKFNISLEHFLDFTSFKVNTFVPTEIITNDELGRLSQKLNEIALQEDKKLKADMQVMGEITLTADKIEQGIYRCRIKAKTTNPMIQTLSLTINKMINAINRDMSQLKSTLESYTKDDFRPQVKIDQSLKADMLAVMNCVNILGDKLSTNAKRNLANGETLKNNAITMSESVSNVASKANQQAASLEETAAAVEEITSITRNNAQNSVKMAKLGSLVKNSANQGHDLADKTALSMDAINTEVSAINEAISVIDQISFQTNILSLNAAVEAATAGEAGKGFAVVAQEVRNLASRSAEAANEIKTLVESATAKANNGKKISDEMIGGYETLNNHINETIVIIQDVSSASKEQMLGIEQINDAVTMLDRVTQENAHEASNVSNIASEVKVMADELVLDAQSKQF